MSVSNGQLANQTTFNTAFMSRTADNTSTVAIVALNNAASGSGVPVANVQLEINAINSQLARTGGTAIGINPTWPTNYAGSSGDSILTRVENLDNKFAASGHTHDGTPGNGGAVPGTALSHFNKYRAQNVYLEFGASGASNDVTIYFSGATAGGTSNQLGVVTTDASGHGDNIVQLIDVTAKTLFEDASGNRVYGRLTFASSVWTVSYYTLVSGVETAYTFPSPVSVASIYKQVFDCETIPTFGADGLFSRSPTVDIAAASATQAGKVTTGTQTFGGAKTFNTSVTTPTLVAGTVSASAGFTGSSVSVSGQASAGSFVGATISLSGSAAVGGNVSATGNISASAGTFTGNLSASAGVFAGTVTGSNLSGTNTGDIKLTVVGSSPNASGVSLAGQTITLQPADGANPGVLSASGVTQTVGGAKTWTGSAEFQAQLLFAIEDDASTTGTLATLPTPTKTIRRVTNSSLVSLTGITAATKPLVAILMNLATVDVTVKNATGTAANQVITGTGSDFTWKAGSAIIVSYDLTAAVWRMVGGGGGGSGSTARTVSSFTGTSVAPVSSASQTFLYTGSSAQTFTGFGTLSGLVNGTRATLMGSDDTNNLTVNESDATDGWIMNGSCTLSRGSIIEFEYNSTLARMVEIARSGI